MKSITNKIWKKSGVYCIVCIPTGHRYVGSTTNLYQRLMKHRHNLRHNVHWNQQMQEEYDRYGENAFDWYILCFLEKDKLKEREKYYIDFFHSEFNLIKDPLHIKMPKESRLKMSISRKEGFKRGTVKLYQEKPIHKYSLSGEYLESYSSIKEACEKSHITRSSVDRFLRGIYRKGSNFLWSLEKKDKLEPYVKPYRGISCNARKVLLVNTLTNEEIVFPSRKALADYFHKQPTNFRYYFIHPNALYKKKYMIKDASAV